ncbi:hypothetical protein B0H14DRAFT_2902402 [Mycena olivaceomarginata]|nr:hypothetical protein B0H14DRAFT_2902402 [Mycena olivaceomarginata]
MAVPEMSPQPTAFRTSTWLVHRTLTWRISSDVLAAPSESATWSPSFACCGGRRSERRRCCGGEVVRGWGFCWRNDSGQFDTDSQSIGDGLLEAVGAWTVLLRIGYYEPNFFRHGDTYGGETGSLVEPDAFRHGGAMVLVGAAGLFDAAIPMARLARWSSWSPLDNVDTYSGEAGSLAPDIYGPWLFAESAIIPPVEFWVLGDLSFSSGVYLVARGRRERTGIFPFTSGGTCMPHWGLGDTITFCSPSG